MGRRTSYEKLMEKIDNDHSIMIRMIDEFAKESEYQSLTMFGAGTAIAGAVAYFTTTHIVFLGIAILGILVSAFYSAKGVDFNIKRRRRWQIKFDEIKRNMEERNKELEKIIAKIKK